MKKRIHVNQHKIRSNKKHNLNEPVITVKTSKSNDYGHEVEILGPSKVIYSPEKPLSWGARGWIETEADVKMAWSGINYIITRHQLGVLQMGFVPTM